MKTRLIEVSYIKQF